MKITFTLTLALSLAFCARAQMVVYDPVVNVEQIVSEAENIAQFVSMVDNQVQQISQLGNQLQQLEHYNTAFGNPATLVNITGANQLIGDLKQSGVGQPLEAVQTGSQGVEAMTFDGNGIYHDIGQAFQTPSGNEVQRQPDIYRENAALENATQNYTNVYDTATQHRQALRADIATTTEQLQNATTASEVQKLTGVLIGQSADLADTDKQIDQATSLTLVQAAENSDDEDKQGKARLEEQQGEFSEALVKYKAAFQPVVEPSTFPTP
jgi:hypothetical protein